MRVYLVTRHSGYPDDPTSWDVVGVYGAVTDAIAALRREMARLAGAEDVAWTSDEAAIDATDLSVTRLAVSNQWPSGWRDRLLLERHTVDGDQDTAAPPIPPADRDNVVMRGSFASTSTPGLSYQAIMRADGSHDCECPGHTFRGHCKHVEDLAVALAATR